VFPGPLLPLRRSRIINLHSLGFESGKEGGVVGSIGFYKNCFKQRRK
jgi:hypothetical protein